MADGFEAIIAAVLAAAPQGKEPAALSTKGDALVASGDLDGALACFDRALRLDVAFPPAWVGRATVLHTRKRDKEALACINRALDADPRCAAALLHKGHIVCGQGLHAEALGLYEAALGAGAPEAHAGRTAMMKALGRTEEVRPAPSPRIDPRAEKKSIREEARPSEGSLRTAPSADRTSLRNDPLLANKSDPGLVLGQARPPSSPPSGPPRRVSTRIPGVRLTQAEQDIAAVEEVRALHLHDRHVEGLRKLEPIAKRCPSSREVWMLRGHILFSLKQYDAALASAERVARLAPTDQDALRLIIKVLAATNKDVRALEVAERLLALAPREAEVHRVRADCLVAAMRHVEAVVAYEKVIHYLPDDAPAWVALGRTLRQIRRVAEARMALTKGLSLAEQKGASEIVTQARELLAKLPSSGG